MDVEFADAEITLDLPADGLTVGSGWRICPLVHPVVRYTDLDKHGSSGSMS